MKVTLRRHEPEDVAPLPGRFHGTVIIVTTYVGDRLSRRDPVDDGKAGQGGTRTPAPAKTGDFDAVGECSLPRLVQDGTCLLGIGGQPEVRPPHPSALPLHRGWSLREEIHAEGRGGPG